MTEKQESCRGIPRKGCGYLSACGRICNKCGKEHKSIDLAYVFDHPTQVNQQLLESLKIAVDTNLGEAWVWPVSAKETWLKNARAAIAAAEKRT